MLAANGAAAANATNSSIDAQTRVGARAYADIEAPCQRSRHASLPPRRRRAVAVFQFSFSLALVWFQFGFSLVSVLARLVLLPDGTPSGRRWSRGRDRRT